MRLYVTVWDSGSGGLDYEFTGTQAEQRKSEKACKDAGDELIRSEPVEVPTDKAGLLEFLNTYRVREGLDHA